ncbi:MAG: hypothetical protein K2X62_03940 [Beijerinckiaceae bacterium]|jgi:hypothetical protein|nr:hypothetical protein [Beijerinckiaceae bacterium]
MTFALEIRCAGGASTNVAPIAESENRWTFESVGVVTDLRSIAYVSFRAVSPSCGLESVALQT